MKTKLLFLSFFMLTALVSRAQDIAVQTPTNTTVIYHDINKALYNAPAGSTVFLPAGAFSVSDTSLIKKQLTIVGVGHRSNTLGGFTQIGGNFNFRTGAENSTLLGIYLSGNVNIGDADRSASNITIQFCNIYSLQVNNSACTSIIVNQNYLREVSNCGGASIQFTNNIMHSAFNINNGFISHNITTYGTSNGGYYYSYPFNATSNSTITDNISVFNTNNGYLSGIYSGSNCIASNNMGIYPQGNNFIHITVPWTDIFINYDLSDFHLKSNIGKNAGTDGTDIGIYGGTGFSDAALPPYPQITFKNIPSQTDEYGNLKIQVKVRAQ